MHLLEIGKEQSFRLYLSWYPNVQKAMEAIPSRKKWTKSIMCVVKPSFKNHNRYSLYSIDDFICTDSIRTCEIDQYGQIYVSYENSTWFPIDVYSQIKAEIPFLPDPSKLKL